MAFGRKKKSAPQQGVRVATFESDNPVVGRAGALDEADAVEPVGFDESTAKPKKPSRRERRAQKKADAAFKYTFSAYPYLKEIKPREKYVFPRTTFRSTAGSRPSCRSFTWMARRTTSARSGA